MENLCALFQDDIWRQKCQHLGWFLPYTPADNEYGAWKRHYVACIHTLDSMASSRLVSISNGIDFKAIFFHL